MAAATNPGIQVDDSEATVLDPETGELLSLKGYGALKGRIYLRGDVDLTRPIAEQVFQSKKTRGKGEGGVASAA